MDSGHVEGKDGRIRSLTDVSTKLRRIAKLAKGRPETTFTTLAHHIDMEHLQEPYRRTRKDRALGVDRVSGREYARDLERNVVSPLLANIYLHEVLDTWFDETVRPRLEGRAFLVRYADDFLLAFERREDAERVFEVLPKRFAKYGLTIHPEKSHMVRFTRPRLESEGRGRGPSGAPPGTFDLLGFTHHWAKSRKGNWVVKRRTMAKRFRRGLQQLRECCQAHRHAPLGEQWRTLSQKLRGHFAYYGITGNYTSIPRFHWFATKIAKRSLDRRSQRGYLPWDKFKRLLGRYPLPTARWLPLDHPVQRNLGPRSRKRECRTSGSVRGRGEQSPRSTSISRSRQLVGRHFFCIFASPHRPA